MQSLDKCQFQPTQVFTYLGLTFSTRYMTVYLPLDKVQAIIVQTKKGTLITYVQECDEIAWINKFVSMAIPVARLHFHTLQFWVRMTYRSHANLCKPLKFTQGVKEPLTWW